MFGRRQNRRRKTAQEASRDMFNTPESLLIASEESSTDVWLRQIKSGQYRTTESSSPTTDIEDIGWRRLGDSSDERELSTYSRGTLFSTLSRAYRQNSMMAGITNLASYFVLGDGLNFTVEDDAERDVWEAFWQDPENDWKSRQFPLFLEWELYGELVLPVFVASTGRVRIGYIHPGRISQYVTDPHNDLKLAELVITQKTPGMPELHYSAVGSDPNGPVLRIGNEEKSEYKGRLYYPYRIDLSAPDVYQTFYFRNNSFMTGRGRPTLEHLLDWLFSYDDALFDVLRRLRFQSADTIDVTCEGLDDLQLAKRRTEISSDPPMPGSVLVHNEKETWKNNAPNLNMPDVSGASLEVKRMLGVGSTTPDHLIGASADVNRATAAESNTPFHRAMSRKQAFFKTIWESMFNYVIDAAVETGKLPIDTPHRIEIAFPEFTPQDKKTTAETLKIAMEAINLAMAGETPLLDMEQSIRLIFELIGEEVPEGYVERLQAEQEKKASERDEMAAVRLRDSVAQIKAGGNGYGGNGNGNGKQEAGGQATQEPDLATLGATG